MPNGATLLHKTLHDLTRRREKKAMKIKGAVYDVGREIGVNRRPDYNPALPIQAITIADLTKDYPL